MALQLPSEILELIVNEIPRTELGPLLFVSKILYHNAIRLLFREVTFQSYGPESVNDTRLLGLFDILSANPLLVDSIQRAHIRLLIPPLLGDTYRDYEPGMRAFARILELLSGAPLQELKLSGRTSPLGLIDEALSALLDLRRTPTLRTLILIGLDNVPYSLVAGDPATDQLSTLVIHDCSLHIDKKVPPPFSTADGGPWKPVVTRTMASPRGAESAKPGPAPLSKLKALIVPDTISLFTPLATDAMLTFTSDLPLDIDSEETYAQAPNPFVNLPSLRVAHLGPLTSRRSNLQGCKPIPDILRSIATLETLALIHSSMSVERTEPISFIALPHFLQHLRNLTLHAKDISFDPDPLASFATPLATSPILPRVETLTFVFESKWHVYGFDNFDDIEPVLGPQHGAWKTCTDALASGRFPSLRVFQVQVKPSISNGYFASLTDIAEFLSSNRRSELVMESLERRLRAVLGKDIEAVCRVVFDTEQLRKK